MKLLDILEIVFYFVSVTATPKFVFTETNDRVFSINVKGLNQSLQAAIKSGCLDNNWSLGNANIHVIFSGEEILFAYLFFINAC